MTRNESLREHVTRVGFDLTVTKTQIAALVEIHDYWMRDRTLLSWEAPWNRLVTGMDGLRRRGLAWHRDPRPNTKETPPSQVYGLTTAGLYVVGLLVESGVWDDYQEMLARSIGREKTKVWTAEEWNRVYT